MLRNECSDGKTESEEYALIAAMVLRKRPLGQTAVKKALDKRLPDDQGDNSSFACFPFIYKGQKFAAISVIKYLGAFLICLFTGYQIVEYLIDVHDYVIASHDIEFSRFFSEVPCSSDYGDKFKNCIPKKCGRGIMDLIFQREKVLKLRQIAEKGFMYGGSSGGASILDLHSGALSMKDKFVNIYKLRPGLFTTEDFGLYKEMKNEIHTTIAKEFDINPDDLHLTKPTFFSRITSKPAKTLHDEYWHPHIDKEVYGSFYYTVLLYLSDFGSEFMGGRFMYVDSRSNKTIEPKIGRLSFFTSGSENKHFIEPVISGTRYAITVSFTCDKTLAIGDPGQNM